MAQAITKGTEVPDINDLLFEREQQVEARMMGEILTLRREMDDLYASRLPFVAAKAKIADAFLSALHSKGISVPSLYGLNNGLLNPIADGPEESVVLELTNLAILYGTMGADFETIMTEVKGNESLMSEWERFMMMLRLAET